MPTSLRNALQPGSQARPGTPSGLRVQTTDPRSTASLLYRWGPQIEFRTWPLNIFEMDHDSDTDFALKEIAGAAIYREWVGENDETIYFRGKLFPYRIGGMNEIEIFEANRRAGIAQLLIRGGNPSTKFGRHWSADRVRSTVGADTDTQLSRTDPSQHS